MAITAISKLTTADYIPERNKDIGDPTVFKLKPLSGRRYMEIMPELKTDENGETSVSGKGLWMAIKFGLVGWDNFYDEDGKELKFNMINIEKIPPVTLIDLAGEIINRSEVGAEERKN